MKLILMVMAEAMLLAVMMQLRDKTLLEKRGHKDRGITAIFVFALVAFCGLRTWCNDTVTYLEIYVYLTPRLEHFSFANVSLTDGFLYEFINSLFKTLNFSTQDYLMAYSVISVIPYCMFVRKHSDSPMFAVYLMFTTGMYAFTFAAIRQCVAIGMFLWATNFIEGKKWGRYVLLIGLAMTFHAYAIIYLIVPFLAFKPWSGWTYVFVAGALAVGFGLEGMLGTIVDVTSLMGKEYTVSEFSGEGVNIFRVLVCLVPLVISFFYQKVIFEDSTDKENIFFNMAMMNGLIMFVGLFGTANYFARLANFFLPAQVVVLPWMISKIRKSSSRDANFYAVACVGGYGLYFIYENYILKRFDQYFAKTDLWSYIGSHFGG